jgi:hypothetical protein
MPDAAPEPIPLWEYLETLTKNKPQNYHTALGEFITLFSIVEWDINNLIRYYLKISREKLNILQGAYRMDNGLDILNKLRVAGRIPKDRISELDEIVSHLRKINRLRNDIVHYGIGNATSGNETVVSNEFYAYKNKNIVSHVVSTRILNFAQIDLAMLLIRINLLLHPQSRARPHNAKVLHETWRYTPQSPAPHDPDLPQTPRRRGSRRGASPE